MEFRLLGRVEISADGEPIPLDGRRLRTMVAALLLRPNVEIDHAELARLVWDEPPDEHMASLRNYRYRLRSALARAGESRLETGRAGTVLRVEPGELDVAEFRRLAASGQAAAADQPAAAVRYFDQALGLWRGHALADAEMTHGVRGAAQRLTEERELTRFRCLRARLDLGAPADLVGELRELVVADPPREPAVELLMLALYRCGRRDEALAVFRETRSRLVEQLGVEPTAQLAELHRRILADDPDLSPPRPVVRAAAIVPRQLPGAGSFVGRREHLAELDARTTAAEPAVPVVILSGSPGVGKTALAVSWAHRAASRFTHGQLFARLRVDTEPVAPAEVLGRFLRALGVADAEIPATVEERAGLFRSVLAGRRLLVVLDDAVTADQVRPLLPGTAGGAVVVTSRHRLDGLVAADGAGRVAVAPLVPEEATELLAAVLGADRIERDATSAAELARLCAYVPLALRVAAANVAARPTLSLRDYVGELRGDRLSELHIADDTLAVRAAFALSHQRLSASAQRMFALLGLHPGADLDAAAATALLGADASSPLAEITGAHLADEPVPHRFSCHDLLRAYAAERAREELTESQRQAAFDRLVGYYVGTATSAGQTAYTWLDTVDSPVPGVAPSPGFATAADAASWLDTEWVNLIAISRHADAQATAALSRALFYHLDGRGHFGEALDLHGRAVAQAADVDDRVTQLAALQRLFKTHWRLGRYDEAREVVEAAYPLAEALGDRESQARTLNNLVVVEAQLGNYTKARSYCEQAVALPPTPAFLGRLYNNLGVAARRNRDYPTALTHYRDAVKLYAQAGDTAGEARGLGNVALALYHLGEHHEALAILRTVEGTFTRLGDEPGLAESWRGLGNVHSALGDHEIALDHLHRGLATYRRLGQRGDEAEVLNDLAIALRAAGDGKGALRHHEEALDLALRTSHVYEQSRAYAGLADLVDSPDAAREYAGRATEILAALSVTRP